MESQDALKRQTAFILQNALRFKWSLQGLGMLRLYLDDSKAVRLHVWDADYAREATPLHSHPWDFESIVVAGRLNQIRYTKSVNTGSIFTEVPIVCGPGGGPTGDGRQVRLRAMPDESYGPGVAYRQRAEEIHWSRPAPGTVTMIFRSFRKDTDHAFVYVPEGQEFVSAEPRDATPREIETITAKALDLWF